MGIKIPLHKRKDEDFGPNKAQKTFNEMIIGCPSPCRSSNNGVLGNALARASLIRVRTKSHRPRGRF